MRLSSRYARALLIAHLCPRERLCCAWWSYLYVMARARKGWCRRVRRGLRFYPDVEAREPDPVLYLVGLIARNG